jgi:hypothetical protein
MVRVLINLCCRTLLASIKFLSQCPCPRCLTPKIGSIGTKADRRWRENEIRQDGNGVWSIIKLVRKWLYVQGRNITSVYVKRMLAPQSLVPMVVCLYLVLCDLFSLNKVI